MRRISAQKSLILPVEVTSRSIDRAQTALLYGNEEVQMDKNMLRTRYRWARQPVTHLLNDYEQLLVYLFSEANEKNARYVEKQKQAAERLEPPQTKLSITKRIWEEILPHRELIIGGGKIETMVRDAPHTLYNGAEMSDGERVIFYLVGQVLSTPEGGVIVIDEPELHLHRSIQASLWDTVEAERTDCLFVYLTHDLDFAASRVAATKVCLKSYDGQGWDWFEVPVNNEVPEEVFLEILGSRKPIVFVEGDKGSWDYFIFQKVYPEFTIAPCGGADSVIHATRSFSSLAHLHRHACYGIIDRDFRDDEQVGWLRDRGVLVLDYSEIENLLLSEAVLHAIAAHLHILGDDFSSRFERIKDIIFEHMTHNEEQLVSSITASKVEKQLKNFDATAEGKAALENALESAASVDVSSLYETTLADVDDIISRRNYPRALQIYNDKGLISEVSPVFGLKPGEVAEYIKRVVSSGEGDDLVEALVQQAPSIPPRQCN